MSGSVRPATVAFSSDVIARRAKTSRRERMTHTAGTTPPTRPASFRNFDGQVGAVPDRNRHDRRAGRGRCAECQCHAKSYCAYHRCILVLRLIAPICRQRNRRAQASISRDKDNDGLRERAFIKRLFIKLNDCAIALNAPKRFARQCRIRNKRARSAIATTGCIGRPSASARSDARRDDINDFRLASIPAGSSELPMRAASWPVACPLGRRYRRPQIGQGPAQTGAMTEQKAE